MASQQRLDTVVLKEAFEHMELSCKKKKNVFLINSRRDGSFVILSTSRQITWDH